MPLSAQAEHTPILNAEEQAWLDALERPLIIGTEKNYHPYNFVDQNGALSGVAGDYMKLLQERLHFEYETRVFDTFAELLAAARAREVDVVPLLVAAPERKEFLSFTQPAYATYDRILTRSERPGTMTLQDLVGLRVGLVRGYARALKMLDEYPGIEVVFVETEIDGLRDLSLGRLDAFVSEIGTSSYYIQREAITNLRVAGEIGEPDYQTMGSRSDWPILTTILGKGLASISEDEQREIMQRWISVGGVDPRELDLIWKRIGTAVGLVAALLLAILFWTFSLRKQVAKRTEQLQTELEERRAIEADKLRLALAVEQSAEFVLIVDTLARIEYANKSFLDACGVSTLDGRPFDSLAEGSSDHVLSDVLEEVGRSGLWKGRVALTRMRGEPLITLMTVSPIVDESSTIDGYIVTGRDVAKEEQLEARVRRNEKLSALGTLASGIAHDFNNLLIPIMGYADLLRAQSVPAAQPFVDGIEEASERARDLIKRIMAFGQEGSGERVPVDLRAEIEDALSFLRSLIPPDVELDYHLQDCGTVLADRTQIQQILLNLCINAGDAMARRGGTLAIELNECSIDRQDATGIEPGDYAVLTVSDTGVGMDRETKAKIFDPYFSHKQRDGGTGLGLSIVQGIVSTHGGEIRVDSAPGQGATFRIYLPVVSSEVPMSAAPVNDHASEEATATVLLVDDDELVLGTIDSMLRGLGYRVSAWSDPHEALGEFNSNPEAYDIILTDLTMPAMSGRQFAESATTIRDDIPVSIMTGNASTLDDDTTPYISKPMQMRELADHVSRLLSQSR